MKIKVTPVKGICKAPYFVVDVDPRSKTPHQDAIKEVEPKSRLSDFGWNFIANRI